MEYPIKLVDVKILSCFRNEAETRNLIQWKVKW